MPIDDELRNRFALLDQPLPPPPGLYDTLQRRRSRQVIARWAAASAVGAVLVMGGTFALVDGGESRATVAPLASASPTTSPGADPVLACERPGYSGSAEAVTGSIRVAFTCGQIGTLLVTRPGPATVENALRQLFAGPTAAEQADGFSSHFGPETAGLLRGVSSQGGLLIVDLDARFPEVRPNASTSFGSMVLLSELTETVRGFNDSYGEVEFRLGGSCESFHAFLEGSCHRIPLRSND